MRTALLCRLCRQPIDSTDAVRLDKSGNMHLVCYAKAPKCHECGEVFDIGERYRLDGLTGRQLCVVCAAEKPLDCVE